MGHIAKLGISSFLGVGSTIGVMGYNTRPQGNVLRAHAIIQGAPGSGISGVITFTQAPADKYSPIRTVEVVARVEGLTPCLHGIHIHGIGSCVNTSVAFGGAGGHFDPGPFSSSTPVDANHPFHMGDLPNLKANQAGIGHLSYPVPGGL